MPHAFDGFSFDLFAFMRRAPKQDDTPLSADDANIRPPADDADEERLRRTDDDMAFWGLTAFPVL